MRRRDPTPTVRNPRARGALCTVLLAALGLLACGSDPETPGEPLPDTVQAPLGDAPAGSAPGPGADSVSAPIPGAPDGQTTDTATVSDLAARLQRLEAQNDSLRTALRVLGGAGLAGGDAGADPAPAGDTASVLGVLDTDSVQHWGVRIVVSVVVLILTGALVRGLAWILDQLAEANAKRRLFFKRLGPIVRIGVWTLGVLFVILMVLRINAEGLLAAGAAVGVAVGFAAQDILKNIFGGLIVLFDQPFQVGDKISVGGTYGEVVAIGLRSTRIVTPDDNLVTVPNHQVVDGQVANANAGELNCQVVTHLHLPGWVDEAEAKRIAFEAAASSSYVFLDKPIVVLVKDDFKETFLTRITVKAYVLDPRYEFLFMSDVTERAREGFRDAGMIGPLHGARAWVDIDRVGPREEAEGERTPESTP